MRPNNEVRMLLSTTLESCRKAEIWLANESTTCASGRRFPLAICNAADVRPESASRAGSPLGGNCWFATRCSQAIHSGRGPRSIKNLHFVRADQSSRAKQPRDQRRLGECKGTRRRSWYRQIDSLSNSGGCGRGTEYTPEPPLRSFLLPANFRDIFSHLHPGLYDLRFRKAIAGYCYQ
jgi:hypothetical protein